MNKDKKNKELQQSMKEAMSSVIAPLLIGLRNDIQAGNEKPTKVVFLTPEGEVREIKAPKKGVDYFTEEECEKWLKAVTPVKGLNYFTDKEVEDFKIEITPRKGVDYFTDHEKKSFLSLATPKKGVDYFTDSEIAQFRASVMPIKGIDYNDGYTPVKGVDYHDGKDATNITPEQIRDALESLRGSMRLDAKAIKNLPTQMSPLGAGGVGGSTSTRFLELLDTPKAYTGKGGYAVTVKADESGLEFAVDSNGLVIGTSPISGGTTSRILFDNAGVLGEYTISGTGSVAMTNSPVFVTPDLGTPSALVGTNITGTASGLTAGNVTTNANLTGAITSVGNATSLGSFTSAQLLAALTDETGTGSAVFATSPTLVTPNLGTPSALTLTNATGLSLTTGVTGILPYANGGTNASTAWTAGSILFAGASALAQDNSNLFWDSTNHFLGLGTVTPTAQFSQFKTIDSTVSTGADAIAILTPHFLNFTVDNSAAGGNRRVALSTNITLTPTTSTTFQTYGQRTILQVTSGNAQNFTNSIFGNDTQALIGGTGTYAAVRGGRFQVQNQSSGILTIGQGFTASIVNSSTGSVATATAFDAAFSNSNASGVITDAKYFTTGNLTNAGTITALYGYYVGDITTGTQTSVWGFYNSDPNAPNYFAGKTGLNVTAPTSMLDIVPISSSTIGQIIKASASQTADLFEAQNSSGTKLSYITSAGDYDTASGQFYRYNGAKIAYAQTALGNYMFGNAGNPTLASMTGGNNTGIGDGAFNHLTSGTNSVAIGVNAMGTGIFTGDGAVSIGRDAGLNLSSSNYSVAIGYRTLRGATTTGSGSVAIGQQALEVATPSSALPSTAIGYYAANAQTTGVGNTAIGSTALQLNTTGDYNMAVGYQALNGIIGSNNLGFGAIAGGNNTSGSNNIYLGYNVATNQTTGSKNIFIGASINAPDSTGSNQLNIGNLIFGTGLTGTGTTIAGQIGIGTSSPVAQFDVVSLSASRIAQIIKGAVSQSVSLLEFRNSSGTTLADVSATGAHRIPDGSVSAPGLSFYNNTGTGFYQVGANQIGVAINGNLRFQMESAKFSVFSANMYFDNNFGFLIKDNGGTSRDMFYADTSNNLIFGATGYAWNSIQFCFGSATPVIKFANALVTLANGANIALGTTSGTQIGTGATQKLALWGATPIVQPATGGAASTFVTNTSLIANDTATFDGYTIGQVVKALRNIGILA